MFTSTAVMLLAREGRLSLDDTLLGRFIDDGLTVAVLTNLGTGNTHAFAMAIAGAIDPALDPYSAITDDDASLTSQTKASVLAYLRGETTRELAPLLRTTQRQRDRARLQIEIGEPADNATFELVHTSGAGTRTYLLTADDEQALVEVRRKGARLESLLFRRP